WQFEHCGTAGPTSSTVSFCPRAVGSWEVFADFLTTRRKTMSTVNLNTAELVSATNSALEEAHMAAAAFLARYSGRTLETYRFDLRSYFEWCAGVGLAVLEAKRAHIELWRTASEQRGLAAST